LTYKSPRIQHYGARATDVLRGGHGRFKFREDEGLVLPVVYVCQDCGFELYRKNGVMLDTILMRMPNEIARKYDNHCPKCGREIEEEVDTGSVKVSEVVE